MALDILGRRSYSEYELRQKLYNKECSANAISDVIQRLLEYGYINDHKLATHLFAKYLQIGKYSVMNIKCKLKQRGLSDEVIQTITNDYNSEEEWHSAFKIVTKRFKSLEDTNKEKICRFLATRGFSSNTISKVLNYIEQTEMK